MRVSKTVRDYIEAEVTKRLTPHYSGLKQEYEHRKRVLDEVKNDILHAANEVAKNLLYDALKEHSYLSSRDGIEEIFSTVPWRVVDLENDACMCWQTYLQQEVQDKVNNIIVTLELGGNKEDLEKMLAEIK